MRPAEPRSHLDGAHPTEMRGLEILRADGLPVHEGDTGEGPLVGRPLSPVPPPRLGRIASALRRLDLGPGEEERHGPRLVDPLIHDIDDCGEPLLTRTRKSSPGVRMTRPNRGQKLVEAPSPTAQPPLLQTPGAPPQP